MQKKLKKITVVVLLIMSLSMVFSGPIIAIDYNYVGNARSKVFHKLTCRYANCKNCVMKFNNKEDAIKNGYRPCKVCNP